LFVGNSSNQAVADGTLYVDIANSRVGIGTTSPASPLTVAGVIESTSGGFKFPDGTTQTTASSGSGSVAFNDLTSKTGGTGEYSTSGNLTSGRASGGVSLTINDGGGNANLTFNHKNQTPEQTGNAGRIRVNTDSTTGGVMEFQVGSGLTSGVAAGLSTYFKIEENLLTSNAVLNMPDSQAIKLGTGNDFIMQFNGTQTLFNAVAGDVYFQDNSTTVMRQTGSNMRMYDSRNLQFGTGGDWAFQYNGTDAYMDLDSGTWRWRDGANGNAIRVQWTPSAGLEFQDGHQLQLGTSNDLRMYHSSDINYFDLVNGDLKIRDVSGTATDRFILGQGGDLYVQGNVGIGTSSPNSLLSINGSVSEKVYNLTGTAIDPDNGTIQYKTLTGNTTFTEALVSGEYVTLMIDDGSGYTITWPTMYWPNGVAPTLATSGYNVFQLWKIGSDLYGSYVVA
jgi:hypothetical protein